MNGIMIVLLVVGVGEWASGSGRVEVVSESGRVEVVSGSGRVEVGVSERVCGPWLTLCMLGTNYASDSLKVSGQKNTFYPNRIL